MIRSSIFITLLSLLLSLVGFFSQMLVAKFFGATYLLDIYFTLASLPLLVSSLLVSSLSYFLTPILLKSKINLGVDYGVFLTHILSRLFFLGIVIAIFGFFIINENLSKIYSSVSFENVKSKSNIIFMVWVTLPFTILLGFVSCQLNAKKTFITPVLLSFFPYLSSIIFLIFFHNQLGILCLPLGLLLGTFFISVLAFILVFNDFSIKKKNKNVSELISVFFKQLPLVIMAMLCFTIYQSIDAYWVTKLGASNLSYFGYAQRLLIALGAIVITAPSSLLVPRITDSLIQKNHLQFENDVILIIKLVLSFGSLIALYCSIFAFEIVRVLFVRGAFSIVDAINVSTILPYMFTGMIFMLAVVIMFRILFVKHEIVFVAKMGCISVILYFIFSAIAVQINSLVGICIGYNITWLFLFIFSLRKILTINSIDQESVLYTFKLILNLLITGGTLYFLKINLFIYLNSLYIINYLLILFISFILGCTIFFTLSFFLKQKEILFLIRNLYNVVSNKKVNAL